MTSGAEDEPHSQNTRYTDGERRKCIVIVACHFD